MSTPRTCKYQLERCKFFKSCFFLWICIIFERRDLCTSCENTGLRLTHDFVIFLAKKSKRQLNERKNNKKPPSVRRFTYAVPGRQVNFFTERPSETWKNRYCGHDQVLILSIIMNFSFSFRPVCLHKFPIIDKKDGSAFIFYVGSVTCIRKMGNTYPVNALFSFR